MQTLPKRRVAELLQVHPNSIPLLVEKGLLHPHQTTRGAEYDPDEVRKLKRKIGASRSTEILTAAAAANRLGVHRNTVNMLRKRGILKGYRFPGSTHYRYRVVDVDALESRRVGNHFH